jgi:hypothetical protein
MIIFSGVEIPSNRTLLEKTGVTDVMLNFYGLRKRGLPKTKQYLISEYFYSDMRVWLDSGSSQVDESQMTDREIEQYAADYEDFVAWNYDRIEGWVEFDSQKWGLPRIKQSRDAFLSDPKMIAVWHENYGIPELRSMTDAFSKVAIPNSAIESVTNLSAVLRQQKSQVEVELFALGTSKPDNLRQIPFDYASTLSWLSPMRRGETIIWDGTKLNRYPKRMKEQARKRYKNVVQQAGLDFDKFLSDDTLEATKVAVWSYRQLEKSMDKDKNKNGFRVIKGGLPPIEDMLADNNDESLHTGLMDLDLEGSDNSGVEVRNDNRSPIVPRDPKEMSPMPVFGYKMKTVVEQDEDGHDVLKEVPIVQTEQSSLRQCNTCFVASNCPAFKQDSTCSFNLPVEVKTKEQLKALMTAIIEMQGQRVAFMRFAEEMNGGYADPNVSQEVDRLFKLVKSLKELEENKEFIRITAERSASGGVLSAIFGDRASALREMDATIKEPETTQIIKQSLED